MTRKLATIRVIQNIVPIEGADLIELAIIDGWQVIIKKDEYNVNDKCIYLEIDSWVPHELAPFLNKDKEPKTFNDVPGNRLRTIKMRGQYSQGLILPLLKESNLEVGTDMTETLGIQLYEKPVPSSLQGKIKGNFPSFIPKTDQERIQNIPTRQYSDYMDYKWEITEKLDGSSCTIFWEENQLRVCSRNLELKIEDTGNAFVKQALIVQDKVKNFVTDGLALQGELVGLGIQGNPYGLPNQQFFVYDVFDIKAQRYLDPITRQDLIKLLGLNHVPILLDKASLGSKNVELLNADGKSILNPKVDREGLVFKIMDEYKSDSFKVISNKWLLKNE